MPTIFSSHGIVIQVFFVDHAPPHIHVLFGTQEAVVDHHNLRVLEGALPPAVMAIVQDIVDESSKESDGGLERIGKLLGSLQKVPELVVTSPWRIFRAWLLSEYCIRLRFMNGFEGVIDMHRLVHNSLVFSALQDRKLFAKVSVVSGVLTWPGGRDLAPDALYRNMRASGDAVLVL